MPSGSSVTVIINPVSGGAKPGTARARAELAAAVIERHGDVADVHVTQRGGHARDLAEAALARGARLVVAWGGDGTINEVASALAFENVPFGIVASGSGNGLARELGIDPRPERAIAQALAAVPRVLDMGEIDGRRFVNVAGIGFDAYVAGRFAARGTRRRGLVGYAMASAQALWQYVPANYVISADGEVLRARAVLVTIANSSQFGNGARIAPGARVDDGLLDLVIVEERSRVATLCQIPRLFNGSVGRMGGCTMRRVRRVTIGCEQPMGYHADGEPAAGGTEIVVRVHPGALRVAVR